MSVRIIVMPTGQRAAPDSLEVWKKAAQKMADESQTEVELTRHEEGRIVAHIIVTPDWAN